MKHISIILAFLFAFLISQKVQAAGNARIVNNSSCDIMVGVFVLCPGSCEWVGSFHVTLSPGQVVNYTAATIPWTVNPGSVCTNWDFEHAYVSQACLVSALPNSPCPYDQTLVGTQVGNCNPYGSGGCFVYSVDCGTCTAGTQINASFGISVSPVPGNLSLVIW